MRYFAAERDRVRLHQRRERVVEDGHDQVGALLVRGAVAAMRVTLPRESGYSALIGYAGGCRAACRRGEAVRHEHDQTPTKNTNAFYAAGRHLVRASRC